jgi:hypothetical protein
MPVKLTKKEKAVFAERVRLIAKEFDVGLSEDESALLEKLNEQARKILKPDMDKMFRKLRRLELKLRKRSSKVAKIISKLNID